MQCCHFFAVHHAVLRFFAVSAAVELSRERDGRTAECSAAIFAECSAAIFAVLPFFAVLPLFAVLPFFAVLPLFAVYSAVELCYFCFTTVPNVQK
jgi:hypothetical protein